MPGHNLSLWETALLYGGMALMWLGGEVGRTTVAGAAGGVVRTLVQDKRRYRDGAAAVAVGAICAQYLSPLAVRAVEMIVGEIGTGRDVTDMAAFAVGLGGMSTAKIIIAFIDTKAEKLLADESKDE